ncbi:MAG: hypothetical protein M1305_06940 [Candidatus Marsarchaeota archaeon]|nr:hypothetical protein [Candidatus Marsarchaeota archaeon]
MNERKPGYANARDVLPPDLVQEIRLHFKGGLLWIPSDRDYFGKRKTLVLELKEQGFRTTDIAGLANLTPRRVRQIVMEAGRNYADSEDQ